MFSFYLFLISLLVCFSQEKTLLGLAHSHCHTDTFYAQDFVNGSISIDTSPLTPFESPRLSAVNYTAWEQWYFDSISADGSTNTVITFFRDPTSHTGLGSLWVMQDAVWSNGTRSSTITYVDEAQVIQCSDFTYGVWWSSSQNATFTFNVTADYQQAATSISTPQTVGTWDITTLGPARYPDGSLYPSVTASAQFTPMLWWVEAMPAGNVQTSFNIKGSPLSFRGYGGVDYFAGSYIWDHICKEWFWMRGVVGPYSIVYWRFHSAIDDKTYTSAFVVQDNTVIFSTQNSEDILSTNSHAGYAKLSLLYGGKLTASAGKNDTGFALDLIEATSKQGTGKTWHFETQHQNIGFETTAYNVLYTRFADSASGGQKGQTVYAGAMNTEQSFTQVVYPVA